MAASVLSISITIGNNLCTKPITHVPRALKPYLKSDGLLLITIADTTGLGKARSDPGPENITRPVDGGKMQRRSRVKKRVIEWHILKRLLIGKVSMCDHPTCYSSAAETAASHGLRASSHQADLPAAVARYSVAFWYL